jgi:hypothetical protein
MSLSVVARSQAAATFRGTITAAGAPVGGVDVWILGPDQHVQTDSTGAFALAETAMGHQIVQLRRVGYTTQRDTLTFAPGIEIRRTYALTPVPNTLDTVHTTAGKQRYLSPRLQAFEDRRTSHSGGRFVSDSVFRANDQSTLMNVLLSQLPGVTRNPYNAIISTRKACRGPEFLPSRECKKLQIPDCYVAIYIDGTLLYRAQQAGGTARPPDLTQYAPSEFAGAEFYAGGASSPAGMHVDDDGCGTLWLWTRER